MKIKELFEDNKTNNEQRIKDLEKRIETDKTLLQSGHNYNHEKLSPEEIDEIQRDIKYMQNQIRKLKSSESKK